MLIVRVMVGEYQQPVDRPLTKSPWKSYRCKEDEKSIFLSLSFLYQPFLSLSLSRSLSLSLSLSLYHYQLRTLVSILLSLLSLCPLFLPSLSLNDF
jgi:hypothetical protein